MKKIWSVLLCLTMILSLAACGSKDPAPAESGAADPAASPAAGGAAEGDDGGCGGERELETDVVEEVRVPQQEHERSGAQGVEAVGRSREHQADLKQREHHDGTHDGGRQAGQQGIAAQGGDHEESGGDAAVSKKAYPTEQQMENHENNPDVEAGDGEEVSKAGTGVAGSEFRVETGGLAEGQGLEQGGGIAGGVGRTAAQPLA